MIQISSPPTRQVADITTGGRGGGGRGAVVAAEAEVVDEVAEVTVVVVGVEAVCVVLRHMIRQIPLSFCYHMYGMLLMTLHALISGFHGAAFGASRGVTQGGILSPTLFNIAVDAVL
ncbi:unknown protein [Seminavis robusta]|uniref:Uncharacterized protein n=1 Tax=Seminavis robusta TaxID=568900 RepID=A0A9N8EKB5_9STRA|nr:unknown protein [Seminavis robusta]|eukprot:Sro1101_g241460.1 n/a (117) ;mRNA; f:27786-28136